MRTLVAYTRAYMHVQRIQSPTYTTHALARSPAATRPQRGAKAGIPAGPSPAPTGRFAGSCADLSSPAAAAAAGESVIAIESDVYVGVYSAYLHANDILLDGVAVAAPRTAPEFGIGLPLAPAVTVISILAGMLNTTIRNSIVCSGRAVALVEAWGARVPAASIFMPTPDYMVDIDGRGRGSSWSTGRIGRAAAGGQARQMPAAAAGGADPTTGDTPAAAEAPALATAAGVPSNAHDTAEPAAAAADTPPSAAEPVAVGNVSAPAAAETTAGATAGLDAGLHAAAGPGPSATGGDSSDVPVVGGPPAPAAEPAGEASPTRQAGSTHPAEDQAGLAAGPDAGVGHQRRALMQAARPQIPSLTMKGSRFVGAAASGAGGDGVQHGIRFVASPEAPDSWILYEELQPFEVSSSSFTNVSCAAHLRACRDTVGLSIVV